MCSVSMVYDSFTDRFPSDPFQAPGTIGPVFPPIVPWQPTAFLTPEQIAELRQMIADFREALTLARRVDVLTRQPDCEDPAKRTLDERVADLERRLDAVSPLTLVAPGHRSEV